jgi:hypothetical protein
MEEVPDKEKQQAGESLPVEAGALLMTEDEYWKYIQEGGKLPSVA